MTKFNPFEIEHPITSKTVKQYTDEILFELLDDEYTHQTEEPIIEKELRKRGHELIGY
jgi:hypothetical protein